MQKVYIILPFIFLIISCAPQVNTTVNDNIIEKPKIVDKDAIWKNNEWHKGELLKEGIPTGRYTVWNADKILMDDGNFDYEGNVLWFNSYYPDGSIGRTIIYDEVSNITSVRWESYSENYERILTPFNAGEKGYAEKEVQGKLGLSGFQDIYNASPEGVSFYNESGDFVRKWTYENYKALISKHTQKENNETWESALGRLSNYWKEYKDQRLKDDDGDIETDYFTYTFQKDVTERDLIEAEARLAVTLPTSYKKFVLEMGLIKFGEGDHFTQKMLHPSEIQSIKHILDDAGGFDDYFDVPLEKIEKVIVFFEDQLDYQYNGWVAFDCNEQLNLEKNIITDIGCKNIYEWEGTVEKEIIPGLNSMDAFISTYVDELISQREP